MLRSHRSGALAVAVVGLALTLAACASSNSSGPGASGPGASGPGASGGSGVTGKCGTVPNLGFKDPSGVVKALGEPYTATYNGYDASVEASKWVNWKPKKTSGFKVGVLYGPFGNAFQTGYYDGIVAGLKESPLISSVVTSTMTTIQASEGLQKFESLIQQGVDLVIYEPPADAAAMIPEVEKAGEAGVPSIAVQNEVQSPYSVNYEPNSYLYGAVAGAAMLKNIGGAGNLLEVQGIAGIPVNDVNRAGFEDAVKLCPKAKIVGSVTGGFVDGTAQSAVLQYLSSHPQPLAGFWEAGAMTMGIREAFNKLGRTLPAAAGSASAQGFLAYMANHPDYKGVVQQVSPDALGHGAAYIALKMLAGDGIKVNAVSVSASTVTSSNVAEWHPGTDQNSVDAPVGPADTLTNLKAYIDKLFTK